LGSRALDHHPGFWERDGYQDHVVPSTEER
jgi:hypothetical protein